MKTAIYIENGYKQIVLTPENDFEKNLISEVETKQAQIKQGSFYHCQGGFVRQSNEYSIFITIEEKDNS